MFDSRFIDFDLCYFLNNKKYLKVSEKVGQIVFYNNTKDQYYKIIFLYNESNSTALKQLVGFVNQHDDLFCSIEKIRLYKHVTSTICSYFQPGRYMVFITPNCGKTLSYFLLNESLENINNILEKLQKFYKKLSRIKQESGFRHNDLQSKNIVIKNNEQFRFIDYDDASFNFEQKDMDEITLVQSINLDLKLRSWGITTTKFIRHISDYGIENITKENYLSIYLKIFIDTL